MNCPSCGSENPDGARFCGECGSSLAPAVQCPECGAENGAEQKFCHQCGARLGEESAAQGPAPADFTPSHMASRFAASAAALEGERKQVTVLFADVQGSQDLAASVDAEVWREVINSFFTLVSEGVHRFEGTVDKFTGDGAMALFGAPIAHEDHARRACYAALHVNGQLAAYAAEIKHAHGLDFAVRIGLNSGEVVVGGVGDGQRMEYTAIGHTVGLAARMEALAEPGKPYVTDHTAALVQGWFELEDLGEFEVKGSQEPLRVHGLLGTGPARTRLEARGGRGISRFVGRDEELAALEAAWARSEATGQIVGVVAEPGLGKSRLCQEFVRSCRERGILVTQGRGVAHGRRVPLLPVLEMLRGYFGIRENDDPQDAREKVAGRLLLLHEDFREALPVLFDFLGIRDPAEPTPDMDAEARQRRLFETLRRLSHAAAQERRSVILVEDLHWLDPGSDAFLEQFVASAPGTRNLMIVNFRPEYHAAWMQKSYYQQLPLLPLGTRAVGELVEDLLGCDPSIDGLADFLADRTGGNPFFVEEVIQGLVECGVFDGQRGACRLARSIDDLTVPPTVQAVLDARIDRLPEREKRVLQSAAVIGKEFAEPVLRRVTGMPEHELADALRALCAAEFLFEKSLYPEAEYSFKHPLTEEAAYHSQLAERRSRTHAAVAQAIAEVYPDRLDERAALLANHWEQAGDALEAARWSARAAWWAGQSHPADALRHWRRVHALADRVADTDDDAASLLLTASAGILQLGWRLGMSHEEIGGVFHRARTLAEESGKTAELVGVRLAYSAARALAGDIREAMHQVEEAHRIALELEEPELIAVTTPHYFRALLGELDEARQNVDVMLERTGGDTQVGRAIFGFSAYIWARMIKGSIHLQLGELAAARREYEETLRLARENNDVEVQGWTLGMFGQLAWASGDPSDSLAKARQGLELAERTGSSFSRVMGLFQLAQAEAACGEWEASAASARASLEAARAARAGLQYEAAILAAVAEAERQLGRCEEAARYAAEGVTIARRQGTRGYEARCAIEAAWALLGCDGPSTRVHELIERADALLGQTGEAVYAPRAREAAAELARLEGDPARRQRELREARRLFEAIGAGEHAARVARELDSFAAAPS